MSELINKLVVPVCVILALIGVILAWSRGSVHAQLLDEARQNSAIANQLQLQQAVYQRLAQELLMYSRQQPAIDQVLVPFGLKQGQPQAGTVTQTNRPSTTPSTPAPRNR